MSKTLYEHHIETIKGEDYVLHKDYTELQDRIELAIKYIWSTKYEYGDLEEDNEDFDIDVYKLLNILEGSDNNE